MTIHRFFKTNLIFIGFQLFIVASQIGYAETNYVALGPPFTTITCVHTLNGADQGGDCQNAYDGDFETGYGSDTTSGDCGLLKYVILEALFESPVDLNRISYRILAACGAYSDYTSEYNYTMYVEFKLGEAWYELPGSHYEGGGGQGSTGHDTGIVTYEMAIPSVQGLRAFVMSYSLATGGESYCHSHAWIYELQGWGPDPVQTPTSTPQPVPSTGTSSSIVLFIVVSALLAFFCAKKQG